MRSFRSNIPSPPQAAPQVGKHDHVDHRPATSGEPSARRQVAPRQATTVSSAQKHSLPPADGVPGAAANKLAIDTDFVPKDGLQRQWTASTMASTRDRKKGVSFLSRITGFNKSKSNRGSALDDEDGQSVDWRPEGMDAQLFSHSATNVGFNPRHPQPPGYIKVRAKWKRGRDFDRLFLAQELMYGKTTQDPLPVATGRASTEPGSAQSSGDDAARATPDLSDVQASVGAVWALEFSKDGKYLAAAGQDKTIRVWAVISSREERRAHERDEEQSGGVDGPAGAEHLSAPVFQKTPYRRYEGHTSTVIDISWSKNNFLLSSSFDKTVRLWHVSRQECLVTFKHAEYCPSIQFHPRDDRFFLAGSLDTKLRLWSIPDKSVAFWQQLPEMITAVAFTPDGKTAIAGTIAGTCLFYDTDGFKYKGQISIKPSGRNTKPAKITGIQALRWHEDAPIGFGSSKDAAAAPYSPVGSLRGSVKLLISSNDSRIRLYNFRDKSMEMKFKGHKNAASQIKALFSDDARFIISGSEDCKTYIWGTWPPQDGEKDRPLELFEANSAITTGAVLAPRTTRMALSASGDPLYDLCNPPPVTLLTLSEAAPTASNESATGRTEPHTSTRHGDTDSVKHVVEDEASVKRAEESPAYLPRTAHVGGHIVVTADQVGNIKVFRQDCAYSKRRDSNWESASVFSRHSRKQAGSILGGAGRPGRKTTRGSNTGSVSSSHSRAASISTQPAGERILDWRSEVQGSSLATSASIGTLDGSSSSLRAKSLPASTERSASPHRSVGASSTASRTDGRGSLRHKLQLTPHHHGSHDNHVVDTAASSVRDGAQTPDLRITAASPTSSTVPQSRQSTPGLPGGSLPPSQPAPAPRGSNGVKTTNDTAPVAANMAIVQTPPPMTAEEEKKLRGEPETPVENNDPLWLRGGRSYVFWDATKHRPGHGDGRLLNTPGTGRQIHPDGSSPSQPQTPGTELAPAVTAVSKLSSEATSPANSHDEADQDEDAGELRCTHCGGNSFKAKLMSGGGGRVREHRLVCQRCGTPAQ